MGLFKKECSLCGGSAGLIKSKKLSDGVICSECIQKVSPLFEDYPHATVESIKEQISYRQGKNKELLEEFNPDKFLGVKRYVAPLCIIDEAARKFTVANGPEDQFRDGNPDIIDFDMVEDVFLQVEEDWSEDDDQYFANKNGNTILLQDRFDQVFWRYDFYLHIILKDHPYLDHIKYKMNFKTTILKVPQRKFTYKRGLEINGLYKGKEIKALVDELGAKLESEDSAIKCDNVIDVITLKNKDKSLTDGIKDKFIDEQYLKKIENMQNHVKRAQRIRRILLSK